MNVRNHTYFSASSVRAGWDEIHAETAASELRPMAISPARKEEAADPSRLGDGQVGEMRPDYAGGRHALLEDSLEQGLEGGIYDEQLSQGRVAAL